MSTFKQAFKDQPTIAQPVQSREGSWDKHFDNDEPDKLNGLKRSAKLVNMIGIAKIVVGGALAIGNPLLAAGVAALGINTLLMARALRSQREQMIQSKIGELAQQTKNDQPSPQTPSPLAPKTL